MCVTWMHNLLRSVIPLLILCYLNYHILQALRHTQSTRRRTLYARNRVTFTLLSVIIVFVLCITPDTIMTFIGLGYKDASYLARAVREITDFLLTINSGINFILYCTFNKAFRNQFMKVFCARCKHRNGASSSTEENQATFNQSPLNTSTPKKHDTGIYNSSTRLTNKHSSIGPESGNPETFV